MDVPWLQRHRLVYIGSVHCGGTFQMPSATVQVHLMNNLLLTHLGSIILSLNNGSVLILSHKIMCIVLYCASISAWDG